MITVEKTIKKGKEQAKVINEQNEEKLQAGEIKAVKKSYTLYIVIGLAALIAGYLLWKRGKTQDGTAISS